MTSFFFLSNPYASDEAVGSLMMRNTSNPAIFPASFVALRWASLKYAGTVMTAWVTVSPRYASASVFNFARIMAEISGGEYSLPSNTTRMSPLGALATLYGTRDNAFFTSGSSNLRPMKRLIEKTVFSGLTTAWLRATRPTRRSWFLFTATTDRKSVV